MADRTLSVQGSGPAERRGGGVRRAIRLARNAVIVSLAFLLTFPMIWLVRYQIEYWALPVENRDGTSMEEAVIVHAANEWEGIPIEYAYAAYHVNPFTSEFIGQELVFNGDKVYDVLRYQKGNGEVKTFWFDITEWYGVFSAGP